MMISSKETKYELQTIGRGHYLWKTGMGSCTQVLVWDITQQPKKVVKHFTGPFAKRKANKYFYEVMGDI